LTLIQALLAAGAVVLLTIVADEWKRLKEIEGEFKSEVRASLEKRFVHAGVVLAVAGILIFAFGTEPFGIDAMAALLGALLGSVTWPLTRIIQERI